MPTLTRPMGSVCPSVYPHDKPHQHKTEWMVPKKFRGEFLVL